MKKIILFILMFAISICGLLTLSCNTMSLTGVPTEPIITPAITINTTNPSTTTTTAPPAGSGTKMFVKAPLFIDKTFDGREINVNLVKFTGSISTPDSAVTVNSIQAVVNSDGSYYAYLDLTPGENNIEIKTASKQTTSSEKIIVTFLKPLIVTLDWPNADINVDYRKFPMNITGIVSDPTAKVEVNNRQANVASNGTFTTQMQLKEGKNPVTAVATRGTDTDTSGLGLEVSNYGRIANEPPGFGVEYTSHFISDNSVKELKAGQMTTLDFAFQADKDIPIGGSKYNVSINRISSLDIRNTLSDLPSLNVDIIPSYFTIYPKIEYHSVISIQTGSDLVPADYYFWVQTNSGHFGAGFSFTISTIK